MVTLLLSPTTTAAAAATNPLCFESEYISPCLFLLFYLLLSYSLYIASHSHSPSSPLLLLPAIIKPHSKITLAVRRQRLLDWMQAPGGIGLAAHPEGQEDHLMPLQLVVVVVLEVVVVVVGGGGLFIPISSYSSLFLFFCVF